MKGQEQSIKAFLEATSSSSPTPGGGSIAAMTGAAAAALLEMVLSLTMGKKGYEEIQEKVKAEKLAIEQIREEALLDIDRDMAAFSHLMTVMAMPKEGAKEKAKRAQLLEEAFIQAATIPLETGERIAALLPKGIWIIEKGNKNAVTDGWIGTLQAYTSVQSAFYNTKINLPYIKNEEKRQELKERMQRIEEACRIYKKQLDQHIEGK